MLVKTLNGEDEDFDRMLETKPPRGTKSALATT
jgi:hypothetical protein